MKKLLILLFLILIPLIGFSQTITLKDILKTSGEIDTLKVVSLIFSEHEKLSIENPLLKELIINYKNLNNILQKQDSLRIIEIQTYEKELENTNKLVKKLKKSQKRIIFGSTLGSIVLFILGLKL